MTNLPESIRVEAEKVKSDFMAKLDYWQTPYSVGFDNALEWLYNFRVKELEERLAENKLELSTPDIRISELEEDLAKALEEIKQTRIIKGMAIEIYNMQAAKWPISEEKTKHIASRITEMHFEELKNENLTFNKIIEDLEQKLKALEDENREKTEALEFYADSLNWSGVKETNCSSMIGGDDHSLEAGKYFFGGNRARITLQKWAKK